MPYMPLPSAIYATLNGRSGAVLLETARFDSQNFRTFLFLDPIQILAAYQIDDVIPLLAHLERWLERGFYLAGYLAYEAGFAFEPRLRAYRANLPYPLIWLGVYHQPIVFNHRTGTIELHRHRLAPAESPGAFSVQHLHFDLSEAEYCEKLARIQAYIRAGDVYQINFTAPFRFQFQGSPLAFYRSLSRAQRVPFAAFIQTETVTILSLSPELFFRRQGAHIVSKPMKGTIRRGLSNDEDAQLISALRSDEKNRAENLMITDLIRNDLGRLAKLGSVSVPSLFEVERYDTLFQMTSTVQAELKDQVTYLELFCALFPCGSITGAPKIRAMEIICKLEPSPRGVYTGAVGFISPEKEAVFSVAIRTAVLTGNSGTLGVGSGIVWDSRSSEEYEECKLKAQFFASPLPSFELLETLLWHNGYPFLDAHLARLKGSAYYFDFNFDEAAIRAKLSKLANSFLPTQRYKVRLRLNRDGCISLDYQVLAEPSSQMLKVALAKERTSSRDRFFRHKTTHRPLYDRLFQLALQHRFADVLFFNERDELTEGAISNVFVQKGALLLTPPLSCGVLNGIYRQHILATVPNAREAILSLSDLHTADAIFICNAVHGLRRVQLEEIYL
ncbi:MAG: aminodeoxychorismate synthase component I [Chloroherpetonaceae bacterium]|nr:aminodeoxychorismate synthase component I [Chloroherpetonaceae bacterium]MCS7212539.1 aminodeoxychorismate synthase component I [Chloroherpetonaceae bacterium]MDW8020769.1 aminodeoxychorismate synthase component I [Chloroherpetonaceae bacterium]